MFAYDKMIKDLTDLMIAGRNRKKYAEDEFRWLIEQLMQTAQGIKLDWAACPFL